MDIDYKIENDVKIKKPQIWSGLYVDVDAIINVKPQSLQNFTEQIITELLMRKELAIKNLLIQVITQESINFIEENPNKIDRIFKALAFLGVHIEIINDEIAILFVNGKKIKEIKFGFSKNYMCANSGDCVWKHYPCPMCL